MEVRKDELQAWAENLLKYVDDFRETIKFIESIDDSGDRLALINKAMFMLQQIKKIIDDFATWLVTPNVQAVITEDLLRELLNQLKNLAIEAVSIDADHTSKFVDRLMQVADNPPAELRLIKKIQLERAGIQPQTQQERRPPQVI